MKYTIEERAKLIHEWRTSGIPKMLFCKQRNIAYHTMHSWVKQQNRKEKTTAAHFVKIKPAALQWQIHSELQFPSGTKLLFHTEPQASFVKQLI